MKLGLQGVTVVYSSSDAGVSNRGECIHPSIVPNGTNIAENPGAFSPSFPAVCPYLTSIGATQVSGCDSVVLSSDNFDRSTPMTGLRPLLPIQVTAIIQAVVSLTTGLPRRTKSPH